VASPFDVPTWPLDGQHLDRAALAIVKIQMLVPERLETGQRKPGPVSERWIGIAMPMDGTRRSMNARRSMLCRKIRRNWQRIKPGTHIGLSAKLTRKLGPPR